MDQPKKLQPLKTTKIKKLVFGGCGLGHDHEGKATFLLNALPDEVVEFFITKVHKTHFEGIAENVIEKSPNRIEPLEEHFLTCSPWQILDWQSENFWKVEIAKEAYGKLVGLPENIPIAHSEEPNLAYRNKIEYSFTENEAGELCLAFYKRGSKKKLPLLDGCLLSERGINDVAFVVLDLLRANQILAENLKSLIIRSNGLGQTIFALFINDEHIAEKLVAAFAGAFGLSESCLGYEIYYSTPKSPASVPTKLYASVGQNFLITKLMEAELKFGLLSFFQVNIPLFNLALADIAQFLDPNLELVDFYCGVGAIGLPLAPNCRKLYLVDNNEQAIEYAQANIAMNQIDHAEATCLPAEKITELITNERIVIVDPPRAGMHKKVVEKLLTERPVRIIYLSCNLSTQARDIAELETAYELKFIKLYNFFPRTPHIEALVVLERKG